MTLILQMRKVRQRKDNGWWSWNPNTGLARNACSSDYPALPALARLARYGFQSAHLSFFSWHPFHRLAGPLLKDKTNSSEFVSSLGQAQTALCAGCWQCSAVCFRQSLKGVETQGKWKLPPMWCSEMEFFFSLSQFWNSQKDRGCSLGWAPPGLMIYSSWFVHSFLHRNLS